MRLLRLTFILLFAMTSPAAANGFDHSHKTWDELLQQYVVPVSDGTASLVDYKAFKSDQEKLNIYLASLASVTNDQFTNWSKNQQLAFLINAYNAFTVKLILDNYPGIASIRDTGSLFTSPWKKKFFRLLGEKRHLDWIEHEMIRGSDRYHEPLIHFAVNCASIGCPALLNEAYSTENLNAQLRDATRRFLSDRSRNYFDAQSGQLNVSSIFDWYEEDFTKGWRGYVSLKSFFKNYADLFSEDKSVRTRIRNGEYSLTYLPYNWQLNLR